MLSIHMRPALRPAFAEFDEIARDQALSHQAQAISITMKILLGQLGSNGDCLYATTLARQIKADYPDCHLTWAISSQSRQVLGCNPHVDEIWEWNTVNWLVHEAAWCALEEAVLRIQSGPDPFDRVVLSQIAPNNFRNYDGTIRPSVLRAYGRPITVPVDSVIVLNDQELERVDRFVRTNNISGYDHRILFECSSKSGQSFVTPQYCLDVARILTKRLKDCCFIFSTHEPVHSELRNGFSAHELGMRENAALTNYCSLFVGCGSGLTTVATSTAAKELPNIQILSSRTSVYASFFHDFEYWGKPTDRFIEMGDPPASAVADAIFTCCQDGLDAARGAHHRPLAVTFDFYLGMIDQWLVKRCKYLDALASVCVTIQRYGWDQQLVHYARKRVLPLTKFDPLGMDPKTREQTERNIDMVLTA